MLDVAARTKGFALAGQHDGADAGIAGDARAQFGDFLAVPRLGYRVALVGAIEGRDQNRAFAFDDQEITQPLSSTAAGPRPDPAQLCSRPTGVRSAARRVGKACVSPCR